MALALAALSLASASVVILDQPQQIAQPGYGGYVHYGEQLVGNPDKPAYVSLGLQLFRDDPKKDSFSEVIVANSPDLSFIGYENPNTLVTSFCCTYELLQREVPGCTEEGILIVKPDFNTERRRIALPAGQTITDYTDTISVYKSGTYQVVVSKCHRTEDTVSVAGTVQLKNKYGFLPEADFGFLPMYGTISVATGVLLSIWIASFLRKKLDMLSVHKLFTAVLLSSVLAAVGYSVALGLFNANGIKNKTVFSTTYLFSALRHTVSRVFMVLACTGYGVISKDLPTKASNILFMASAFFCLRAGFEFPGRRTIAGIVLAISLLMFDLAVMVFTYFTVKSLVDKLDNNSESFKSQYLKRIVRFVEIGAALVGTVIFITVFVFALGDASPVRMINTVMSEIFFLLGLVYFTYLLWPSETIKLYSEFTQVAENENENEQGIIQPSTQELAHFEVDDDLNDNVQDSVAEVTPISNATLVEQIEAGGH